MYTFIYVYIYLCLRVSLQALQADRHSGKQVGRLAGRGRQRQMRRGASRCGQTEADADRRGQAVRRQADIHTQTKTDIHTHTDTGLEGLKGGRADGEAANQPARQAGAGSRRQPDRQENRQTGIQAGRQAGRLAAGQQSNKCCLDGFCVNGSTRTLGGTVCLSLRDSISWSLCPSVSLYGPISGGQCCAGRAGLGCCCQTAGPHTLWFSGSDVLCCAVLGSIAWDFHFGRVSSARADVMQCSDQFRHF